MSADLGGATCDAVERAQSNWTAASLYRLRSDLVHGLLLGLDLPRGFGALVPRDWSQRETLEAAHRASRVVAINWLRGLT